MLLLNYLKKIVQRWTVEKMFPFFFKIYKKTTVSESIFNQLVGLQLAALLNRDSKDRNVLGISASQVKSIISFY